MGWWRSIWQSCRGSAVANVFFLLGLLHNLGELVVAAQAPELSAQCQELEKKVAPWKKQQQLLGFTYAECSAEIMKLWQLPSQLHFPVASVHDEDKAISNKEIGILFTAARAATALASDGVYSVGSLINPVVLEAANLDEALLEDALNFTSLEANKMLAILNPRLS